MFIIFGDSYRKWVVEVPNEQIGTVMELLDKAVALDSHYGDGKTYKTIETEMKIEIERDFSKILDTRIEENAMLIVKEEKDRNYRWYTEEAKKVREKEQTISNQNTEILTLKAQLEALQGVCPHPPTKDTDPPPETPAPEDE